MVLTFKSYYIKFIMNQCALDVSVISSNPEIRLKFFSGKKYFSKCHLPDFKLYPSNLTNKKFSMWCTFYFSLLFCIVYCDGNRLKINITPCGESIHPSIYRVSQKIVHLLYSVVIIFLYFCKFSRQIYTLTIKDLSTAQYVIKVVKIKQLTLYIS